MKPLCVAIFLGAFSALVASSVAAQAAPRVLFRGCAHWTMPFCLTMKTTDGKTYQLLEAGPAFPPNTPVLVYSNKVGDVGLCFAATAKVVSFKVLPGRC